MDILTYIGIFCFGTLFGVILTLGAILILKRYVGIIEIVFNEEEEKVLYSLELFDDPESLMTQKEVRFKINTSEEGANRG
jgi:hypothetical protein